LCIKTGNICWWNGFYQRGDWNDQMIFKDALVKNLEVGEWCETDQDYRGSALTKVECPGGLSADPDQAVKGMAESVRSQQETVNKRFKIYGVLNTPTVMKFLSPRQCLGLLFILPSFSL
jgi:hypothetical protein